LAAGGDSTDQIRVPAQVLGRSVQNHVNPKFQGALVDGRSKGTVNQGQDLVLASERHRLAQVNDSQRRVGRRFEINQRGVGADGPRVLIVAIVSTSVVSTPSFGSQVEKLGHAAVNIALGNDMIAAPRPGGDAGGDCSHAGGEQQGGIGALEFRDRSLHQCGWDYHSG
jgi:hypothetical protein